MHKIGKYLYLDIYKGFDLLNKDENAHRYAVRGGKRDS